METRGSKRVAGLVDTTSYIVDTGTADTYAVALLPAITAYTTGLRICFQATNPNTGSSTLNVNALGVKTIKKDVTVNLASGDILDNQVTEVIYDGTNFQLVSKIPSSATPLSTADVGTSPAASQTDAVTHSLGKTPTIIRIYAIGNKPSSGSATNDTTSMGIWNSTGNRCIYRAQGATAGQASSTAFAIRCSSGATAFVTGVIGNVGATTFDIVWTESGTSDTTPVYLWEAM